MGALQSLEYDDDEKFDRMVGPDKSMPDYPPGCQFSISNDDLEQAGIQASEPDETVKFSAMAEVVGVYRSRDDCRVDLEMQQFAGPDGKFCDLSQPARLCLCGPELEKMGLEADCERGDTIHLIGTARLENTSSTEFGGEMATLQIVKLTYEDESTESRDGG